MSQPVPPIMPVIFRTYQGEVTAYFPTQVEDEGYVVCYAHIGQHSTAHPEWLRYGKRSKPSEYADLLNELRGIYENTKFSPVELKVYQKATGKAAYRRFP